MIRHGNWCLTNSLNKIGNSNCSWRLKFEYGFKTNITVSDKDNDLSVIMNGDHVIQKIIFSDSFIFSNTKKLEALVKDTINSASKEVDDMSSKKMSVLTKQGLPADLPF